MSKHDPLSIGDGANLDMPLSDPENAKPPRSRNLKRQKSTTSSLRKRSSDDKSRGSSGKRVTFKAAPYESRTMNQAKAERASRE